MICVRSRNVISGYYIMRYYNFATHNCLERAHARICDIYTGFQKGLNTFFLSHWTIDFVSNCIENKSVRTVLKPSVCRPSVTAIFRSLVEMRFTRRLYIACKFCLLPRLLQSIIIIEATLFAERRSAAAGTCNTCHTDSWSNHPQQRATRDERSACASRVRVTDPDDVTVFRYACTVPFTNP